MAGSCIIALPSIVSSTWFKQKTCRLRLQGRKAGPWDLEMFFSPVTGSGVGVDGNKQLERGLPFTFQAWSLEKGLSWRYWPVENLISKPPYESHRCVICKSDSKGWMSNRPNWTDLEYPWGMLFNGLRLAKAEHEVEMLAFLLEEAESVFFQRINVDQCRSVATVAMFPWRSEWLLGSRSPFGDGGWFPSWVQCRRVLGKNTSKPGFGWGFMLKGTKPQEFTDSPPSCNCTTYVTMFFSIQYCLGNLGRLS